MEGDGKRNDSPPEIDEFQKTLYESLSETIVKASAGRTQDKINYPGGDDKVLGRAVDGVMTRALVDTGSPATIVSLDHVMRVLTAAPSPNQSTTQLKEDIVRRFLLQR